MPLKIIIKDVDSKKKRPRPLEPDGVAGGKHGDLHQPEEQIMPDEPTIRKKKRKRRTVDGENPSESDLKTKLSSDLFYSCKIDKVSEAQIVDAVQSINYSIDNLILNILDGVKKSKLSYPLPRKRRDIPTKLDSNFTLLHFLLNSRLSDHTRDMVVEFILCDLILTLVHKHFFKGGHFFGVGSETLHKYLETMFSKLVASENSDPIAIQRWRSMSVEAVFQMNDEIESQLNDQLIKELECMLRFAFPLFPNQSKKTKSKSIPVYESIVRGEQQSLVDIVHQARKLSFMIQHEIVSCQLLVSVASATRKSSDGDDVLGTSAFGLQRILGSKRITLIKTKEITAAMLRSLYE